jgi:DnaJ-class molecular chaperone
MKLTCPECNGKKDMVYSCCTGEPVDNDYMLCPVCREHLGEEPCNTCGGDGFIEESDEPTEQQLDQYYRQAKHNPY